VIGHLDPWLTRSRRKSGEFKDKRSAVYVRKDGSLRIRLFGKDKSNLRDECFTRDGWDCVDDQTALSCEGLLEMSHQPPISDPEGSDEIDKVRTRCKKHHAEFDHHAVRWSKP